MSIRGLWQQNPIDYNWNLEISRKNQENKEGHMWKWKESKGVKRLGMLKPETVKTWKKWKTVF